MPLHADAIAELERAPGAFDLVVCDPPKLAPNRTAANKAMNRMRRVVTAAANGMSSVDRCDGATMNVPDFGTRSRPRTCTPNTTRASDTMTARQNA